MRNTVLRAVMTAVAVAGVALVAGAQGPPPPGGFGGRGPGRGPGGPMEGSFEFGRLVGGFGGRTVLHKPFQATFTITRSESFQTNSITNTTTGTVARGDDGSTFRDVTLPAIGPWAASGKPQEFQYIKNLTTMMDYIVNVTKQTFEAFASHPHNPPQDGGPGGKGRKGPDGATNPEVVVTTTPGTYTDPANNHQYAVEDRKITRTIPTGQIGNAMPIMITSERLFYPGLDLVLQESHNDPRFGSSTYQLSNIVLNPSVAFIPPSPPFTQVQGKGFGPRGDRRHDHQPPPPPPAD